MPENDSNRKDLVRKQSEEITGGKSEILSRGLDLIESSEEIVFTREEVIELLNNGADTLICNCVLDRGRMIAEKVSKGMPLRIVAESNVKKNWQEAVELCRSLKPNLIMTCSHGTPMIKRVREFDQKVAIALFSVHVPEFIIKALDAGADSYTRLPPPDEELIAATKLAIQKRASVLYSLSKRK